MISNLRKATTSQLFDAYSLTGAGQTRWFFCATSFDLDRLNEELRPGSLVTAYFDGRIQRARFRDIRREHIEEICSDGGECVAGQLVSGSIQVNLLFVEGWADFLYLFNGCDPDSIFFYGAYPNDGLWDVGKSISFIVPDEDGVFREHPY
jgi:hypothetical protein